MLRPTLLLIAFLAGCASCHAPSWRSLRRSALSAEVRRYSAAHGSGKGLIVRIAIPQGWAGAVGFDSLDLGGHLLPCRLTDGGAVLEGNWFLPIEPPSVGMIEGPVASPNAIVIPDLSGLQPAFVHARSGHRRVRIPISEWKEVSAEIQ